jgi:hypothetical protein
MIDDDDGYVVSYVSILMSRQMGTNKIKENLIEHIFAVPRTAKYQRENIIVVVVLFWRQFLKIIINNA